MDIMNLIMTYFIFFAVVLIIIYILISIFLNKFNKLLYGKGTCMSWLPGFQTYLLGKLAINKVIGLIMVIMLILKSSFKITNSDGITSTFTFFSENIRLKLSTLYHTIFLVLLIYAIIKYNKLKKNVSENKINNVSSQTIINLNDQSSIQSTNNDINNNLNNQNFQTVNLGQINQVNSQQVNEIQKPMVEPINPSVNLNPIPMPNTTPNEVPNPTQIPTTPETITPNPTPVNNTKYCTHCGSQVDANSTTCPKCGTYLG
jgi:hypothetical protein